MPTPFSFSPDGRLLAAATTDGIVHVWDVATGQEHVPGAERPHFIAFSPGGKKVITAGLERQDQVPGEISSR